MTPVSIGSTCLKFIISPQIDAEKREPGENEYLISIVGNGYAPFTSSYKDRYSEIHEIIADDIGSGLREHEIEKLRNYIRCTIELVRKAACNERNGTVTFHCLAGMSRSTAFATGCAAAISPETISEDIKQLAEHVTETEERKFMPNPLLIKLFEEELGFEKGCLSEICHEVSEHFRTWVKYWDRKEAKSS